MNGKRQPLVFDIKRYALDDGPGIRTVVFFKGCPLACVWCHNPESMRPDREIAWHRQRCIGCHECVRACPEKAVDGGPGRIDRGRCTACGACVDACPATALQRVGRFYPVAELITLLMKDRLFYEVSAGGVTVSGGEPTLHAEYLAGLLRTLKAQGVHTAIETCGLFERDRFRKMLLPHLDLICFDVKLISAEAHRRLTGRGNGTILRNLAWLAAEAPDRLFPRVPLVPGVTATEGNLRGIGKMLGGLGIRRCGCLPYNPGGTGKRQAIGQPVPDAPPAAMMSAEEERQWTGMLQAELSRAVAEVRTPNPQEEQSCRSIFTMP
ncbi:MAG: glycyl-radical enzyme activating protein [Desulfobacteraceae bacterium]|nr:glycyl-radical enzyme activating protein [Desulfobacteraceae bacterium]